MLETKPDTSGRRLLHTRRVDCTGYLRKDGLFEFDGWLLDTKTYDAQLSYKLISAGEPVHHLGLRLTIDRQLVIQAVEVLSRAVPTPFCSQVNAAYAGLVGIRVGPGMKKRAAERVGATLGCTHLTELLGPLATTVLQTITMLFLDKGNPQSQAMAVEDDQKWVIGTCHVYRPGGEMARRLWPETASTSSPDNETE